MAIIQALLALIFRSAGRLLNTAFGWATVMLFGKVPQDRQIYLSGIAFGAVLWLVALVAVAFPNVGTFLLALVTIPSWVDKNWIRLAMAVAVVVLPAIVGLLSTRMVADEERPRGAGPMLKAIARGYPYTLGLALTLVVMTVFAPVVKIRNLIRRWTVQHVPVIIEPPDYAEVLDDVERALNRGGLETTRRPAEWLLRFPTKLLALFARRAFGSVMADQLTRLVSKRAEVLVHPADLVISGRETDAVRARAVLSEHLTYTKAHLTWTKEANDLEDRLRSVWEDLAAGRRDGLEGRVQAVAEELRRLDVPYEEWDVLFREVLLTERALRQAAGAKHQPERSAA